jgi:hypothetical protein
MRKHRQLSVVKHAESGDREWFAEVFNMLRSILPAVATVIALLMASAANTPADALSKCPASRAKSEWKHCRGTIRLPDGAKYVGEIRNGMANGQGTYTSRKYGTYDGGFKNGKFNGRGTLVTPNRGKYTGTFVNGRMNGRGVYSSRKYGTYVGSFKNGKFHGYGKLTLSSGWKYVGEFRYDKLNGQATATSPSGKRSSGIWRNGRLVKSSRK